MKKKYLSLFIISLSSFALDQFSKLIVIEKINPFEHLVIIPGFFNLVHLKNAGVAFGLFADGAPFKLVLLAILALIPLIYIVYTTIEKSGKLFLFGMSLMLGGAFGNIIDRLRLGSVIDFIDIHIKNYHWPAFNIADIAVCLGAFLLICHLIQSEIKNKKSESKKIYNEKKLKS